MKKVFLYLLVILSLAISNELLAQGVRGRKKPKSAKKISGFKGSDNAFAGKRYWAFGGGISAYNYFGDIAPSASYASTDISFTRPGFNANAFFRFGPRLSTKIAFNYGRIRGDDSESAQLGDDSQWRYVRNLQFRNNIKELSAVVVMDLFKNQGSYANRVRINPYLFVGAGVFHHNPKALAPSHYFPDIASVTSQTGIPLDEGGNWVPLQPLRTGGVEYSKFSFSFPVGIGVRYKFTKSLDFSFEMAARYLSTDFIDDMGTNYVSTDYFLNKLGEDFDISNGLPQETMLALAMADRSIEPTAIASGQIRDVEGLTSFLTFNPRTGKYFGFGEAGKGNYRGTSRSNDVFAITTISASYIMGSGPFILKLFKKKNAKFR